MYKNVESNETRENVECKWERAYRAYFSRTPLHFMWLDVARVSMCVGARARTGQACLKGWSAPCDSKVCLGREINVTSAFVAAAVVRTEKELSLVFPRQADH